MGFLVEKIKHLYDFQSNYISRNGFRYHYLDEGQGDPIVMLHGNPSWSFMFRELLVALRSGYRVIVPDHMGCGLSDKPKDTDYPYTLDRRVTDLEYLLEQLGIQQNLTLVMHDWGGLIGMTYATRQPKSVSRLVVLNTAAFLLPTGKNIHWSLRLCRNSRLVAYAIRKWNIFSFVAGYLGSRSNLMTREIRRAYRGPYDSWDHRIAVLRFIEDIPLEPKHPSYALLQQTQEGLHAFQKTPTLICWGQRDFVFDGDFLDEWIWRFPEAEVHRFPKAGHNVLEDSPVAIVDLVRDFLRRHTLNSKF